MASKFKRRIRGQQPPNLRLVTPGDPPPEPVAHDRRSSDLTRNANVRAITVDDPLERGAKIVVLQSLRGDTLTAMHNRGQLDQAQYMAGREMQKFYEQSEIGNVKAMDPGKEAVDGGSMPEMLTEEVQRAIAEVARLEKILGREGATIARDVLCHGLTLQACAQARNLFTTRGELYIGGRFREVIETLAVEMGFAGRKVDEE